jgi:hypothetical protein
MKEVGREVDENERSDEGRWDGFVHHASCTDNRQELSTLHVNVHASSVTPRLGAEVLCSILTREQLPSLVRTG